MAGPSKIEWTEATWNPIVGCSILTPGCTNCYAMKMAARIEAMKRSHYDGTTKKVKGNAVWTGKLALAPDHILLEPLKRKKPTTYFVNSMGDLFHEHAPDEWIDKVFAVMALCPQHTFQALTKRAERMRTYLTAGTRWPEALGGIHRAFGEPDIYYRSIDAMAYEGKPLPNVWLGVSTERQQEADELIPHLLQTPAAVRFISAEPLLGPIDLRDVPYPSPPEDKGRRGSALDGHEVAGMVGNCVAWVPPIDWVIVGGESGPGARPMHPDWARSLRDQCTAAGVAYFFKQWGRYVPQHNDPEERFFASVKMGDADHLIDKGWFFGRSATQRPWFMFDLGKKAAGRLLDGIEHNAMPKAAA